jgi:hypothetical protein
MIPTHNITKLYHQFLKPNNISIQELNYFAIRLTDQGFITPYLDDDLLIVRYARLPKFDDKTSNNELFKLIGDLK